FRKELTAEEVAPDDVRSALPVVEVVAGEPLLERGAEDPREAGVVDLRGDVVGRLPGERRRPRRQAFPNAVRQTPFHSLDGRADLIRFAGGYAGSHCQRADLIERRAPPHGFQQLRMCLKLAVDLSVAGLD